MGFCCLIGLKLLVADAIIVVPAIDISPKNSGFKLKIHQRNTFRIVRLSMFTMNLKKGLKEIIDRKANEQYSRMSKHIPGKLSNHLKYFCNCSQ
jgi:hypothetical protein